MDRVACVDLPALPLQLLLSRPDAGADAGGGNSVPASEFGASPVPPTSPQKRRPAPNSAPVAVVDRDDPQGRILWVNRSARALGILPGQRYAAGLSLARDLHAGVVEAEEIAQGVKSLVGHLRKFTPEVEPGEGEPGVFWLGAGGLQRLWSSASCWAEELYQSLVAAGFQAAVTVGFTRFGCYAVARSSEKITVFRTPEDEDRVAREVPLSRLGLDPGLRDALARLGVRTVGQFRGLPAAGLLERFGPEAHRLHRLASGKSWTPLDPAPAEQPLEASREFEHPERELERLVFGVKMLLDPLLDQIETTGQMLKEMEIGLKLESGAWCREILRPAQPTLSGSQLLDLVRLRLEFSASHRIRHVAGSANHPLKPEAGTEFTGAPVEELSVRLQGVRAQYAQLRLFTENPRRDLAAAGRALARVRAEFGVESVVRARLKEGHLPEATFLWEPLEKLEAASPFSPATRILIRRLRQKPLALPPRPHHLRDDGWLIRGLDHGPVTRFIGPYVVSGGWWTRPLHREYHFARTERGDLLWVYFDRRRRRWFQQGEVQ